LSAQEQASGATGTVNVSLTTLQNAAGSNVSPAADDLVIAVSACGSTADRNLATPSGWTALTELYSDGTTTDTNLSVFYKIMGGTPDTAISDFPRSGNLADGQAITIFCFRGVDTTTPLDVAAVSATGTASTQFNAGSITPSTAGAWIFVAGGGGSGATSLLTNPGDLSSTTNHFRSAVSADTNDAVVGAGIKTDWASGAFNPSAFTGGTTNAGDSWAAYTIALRPASGVAHTTSGALTGQIGSVSGSASSATARPSSGALTGQIGSVAGTAAHIAKHATSSYGAARKCCGSGEQRNGQAIFGCAGWSGLGDCGAGLPLCRRVT
jgi:hypothetical protein